MMYFFRNICRMIVGIVFIYSGFVKGIDPMGSAYKFAEYFTAFGLGWLKDLSLFCSFVLSLVEFLIGCALLFKLHIRKASWAVLLFMLFFTILTFILALTDPVSDCGCFGDALVLSNWETFYKNVVLLLFSIVIWKSRDKYRVGMRMIKQEILLFLLGGLMFSLTLYCYNHLPILDFRPYAIGNNIAEGMQIPEGEMPDQYEVTLLYKNKLTGKTERFSESNYPWQDTVNYEFSGTEEKLIKKGHTPPVKDFSIIHPERGDISQELLEDPDYIILAVARHLDEIDQDQQFLISDLARYAEESGYRFYGLTSATSENIRDFTSRYQPSYSFCLADDTQLKTMIRSNPGIIILRRGTILGKWSGKDIPTVYDLKEKELGAYCIQYIQQQRECFFILSSVLFFLGIYMLFYVHKKHRRSRTHFDNK